MGGGMYIEVYSNLQYQQDRLCKRSDFLPDKNSFAFDLVGNVGDCEFVGERHSFAQR